MSKRFVTVMVLEDSAAPVRTLHVRRDVVAGLALLVAVMIVSAVWLVGECSRLRERVAAQRADPSLTVDWRGLRELVASAERDMTAVRALDRTLRLAVGVSSDHAAVAMAGQGGGDTDGSAALQALMRWPGGLVAWARGEIATLDAEIELREREFHRLQTFLDRRNAALAAAPTILPARGWLAARFGYRASPFTGAREFHEGIDIAAPVGAPVRVTAAGTVRFAGVVGSYGNVVVVDHGGGVRTLYAHNSSYRVRVGQRVQRGDVIAAVGATGRTTGSHVHYEVQVNGAPADPLRFAIDTSGVLMADLPGPARRDRGVSGSPPVGVSSLSGASPPAPGNS
jgi:murein DD-endopeptidase MepM/ murein hydrolase activator NlpD